MVGAGMSALCRNEYVTEEEFEFVMKIFSGIGSAEEVEESLMDAVQAYPEAVLPTSICLSKRWPTEECLRGFRGRKRLNSRRRPFWERQDGSGDGRHPGELKDSVCSPAGTTIEGSTGLGSRTFPACRYERGCGIREKSKNM